MFLPSGDTAVFVCKNVVLQIHWENENVPHDVHFVLIMIKKTKLRCLTLFVKMLHIINIRQWLLDKGIDFRIPL